MESLFYTDFFLQVRGLTPGRAATLLPMLMGLTSLVIGWLALARTASRMQFRQLMAIIALFLGCTGIILGGLHLARATGGFGTGSGKLGAIVASVLGAVGILLSGLTLLRLKRTSTTKSS